MATPSLTRNAGDSGHGPLTLMLSMNLIILALFIMLNSVAQQATVRHEGGSRAAPINDQVGYAHTGPKGTVGGSSTGANLDTPARARQVHDDVQGEVATTLRLDAPPPDSDADARRVRLVLTPGQVFFQNKDHMELVGGARNWLENLASVLSGPARGWQGQLRIVGNGAELPGEVVLLGQALGAGGVSAIGVGYAPGEGNQVVLTLTAPAGIIADRGVERLQQVLQQMPGQLDGLSSLPNSNQPDAEAPGNVE